MFWLQPSTDGGPLHQELVCMACPSDDPVVATWRGTARLSAVQDAVANHRELHSRYGITIPAAKRRRAREEAAEAEREYATQPMSTWPAHPVEAVEAPAGPKSEVTLVVTLTCGCSFEVYGEDEAALRSSYAIGYWYSCPRSHSAPVSYDPDTGEPRKYDRNQQAVSVVATPADS